MMKKILFLEGPIQTGKSTLIRTCLGDFLSECGGFTSQRLLDPDGAIKGFRLCPAASPLTARDEGITDGVFKYFRSDGPAWQDQQVFDTAGVRLLQASKKAPLILLDEIGGSELLCESFRSKLYEILGGPVPCLGVLKLSDNARRLERSYRDAPIASENLALRRHITEDLDGTILYYDRLGDPAGAAAVTESLQSFIKSIASMQ